MSLPRSGRSPAFESDPVAAERFGPDAMRATSMRGRIEVSERAIASVAGRAVAECYGVVGVAARRPRIGPVELLSPEHYTRGVQVGFTRDHIMIDLYVVLEYGLRISEIARSIMSSVKFAVEQALGVRVVQVNVNVQALRVSSNRS